MCTKDWWKYTYSQVKPKYSEKNFFECHFVYETSKMDRPGIEPASPT